MPKRFLLMLFAIATASLWITPAHEVAHQFVGILAGGIPQGISLWFDGPILVGETFNSLWQTGGLRELFAVAGPVLLLYIPACIALWKWSTSGLSSLLSAVLVGQGGFYTAWNLYWGYGDAWVMTELGIPLWALVLLAVVFLFTAARSITRYLRAG